MPETSGQNLQVIRRTLRLLECFSAEEPSLTLTQLCRKLELPKSTVHRLLAGLLEEGYLVLDPDTLKYHVSLKVLHLARAAVSQLSIEEAADLCLHQIVAASGGTANLAILHKAEGMVLYLKTISPNLPLSNVGRLGHVHSTALGKVFAAFLPEPMVDQILVQHGMPASTPQTITDASDFKTHLRRVRQRGYAVDDQEANPGFFCIGAPVQDHTGQVVAAISTTVPAYSLTGERLEELANLVCDKANSISRGLGCPEPQIIRFTSADKAAAVSRSTTE